MPGLAGEITCRDWLEELRAGTGRGNYVPGLAGVISCRDWQDELHAGAADGKRDGLWMGSTEGRSV